MNRATQRTVRGKPRPLLAASERAAKTVTGVLSLAADTLPLLFLAVFLGAIFWVFRRRSGELYVSLAAMPLSEPKPVSEGNEK